jgi:hypothetical protein
MPVTLNDIIDLSAQQEFDFSLIEGYGCRQAPCLTEEITINRATEYVLKINGYQRRVYNWEQSGGNSRMYVKLGWGERFFLPEDAVRMLHYGEPHYGELTPVAQAVKVAA